MYYFPHLPFFTIVAIILVIYVLLGCLMDSLAMILLTIPVFFPIIVQLDFGMSTEETAIWFGILTLIVVEVGLITPPVGLNIYVLPDKEAHINPAGIEL